MVTNFRNSSHLIDTALQESRGLADTAMLPESAGVGFWVHLIHVRHSLDSALEPLHPREEPIKEPGPQRQTRKLPITCVADPVIGARGSSH